MDISVIVPLYNEEESLKELLQRIHESLDAAGLSLR